MNKILGLFLISEPPTEDEFSLAKQIQIENARVTFVYNGNISIVIFLCFVVIDILECSTFGTLNWPAVISMIGMQIITMLISFCLVVNELVRWLQLNREAGCDVIYPAGLPKSMAKVLDRPDGVEWRERLGYRLMAMQAVFVMLYVAAYIIA